MSIQDLKDKGLILFEVIVGSRSFGLETSNSDTDIKGVFYLPKEKFFGLEYIPQISNDTNDIVYYELGRFIELLLKSNPNILELLASPEDCILYRHPIIDKINIKYFLSKQCKETFAGYAAVQIKKATGLKKKILNPLPKNRKDLLDFCYVIKNSSSMPLKKWLIEKKITQEECGLVNIAHSKDLFALYIAKENEFAVNGLLRSNASNELSLTSIPKNTEVSAYLSCNKDAYSSYCKEYKEYWDWIEKRNEDRYNTNSLHGKNYDSKNMMHTIRLLQSAKQILTLGTFNIRVGNRKELLEIKSGAIEFDELMNKANKLLNEIETASHTSLLPERPDPIKAEELLVEIRKELY